MLAAVGASAMYSLRNCSNSSFVYGLGPQDVICVRNSLCRSTLMKPLPSQSKTEKAFISLSCSATSCSRFAMMLRKSLRVTQRSASVVMVFKSSSVSVWPRDRMRTPSSYGERKPVWFLSRSWKASVNSRSCSSVSPWSMLATETDTNKKGAGCLQEAGQYWQTVLRTAGTTRTTRTMTPVATPAAPGAVLVGTPPQGDKGAGQPAALSVSGAKGSSVPWAAVVGAGFSACVAAAAFRLLV
mmetsp:Transcript_37410/g.116523  ORF Transcript_37410/g.116523 Transcript_37410/m.116523 type:complete len:241 (+) Transcript_37410:159-881(+)